MFPLLAYCLILASFGLTQPLCGSVSIERPIFYSYTEQSTSIFHPCGHLAWDGSKAYHSNLTLAYEVGPDERARVYYERGENLWKGLTYNQYREFNWRDDLRDHTRVYFRNGNVAWEGVTCKEYLDRTWIGQENLYIYHNNGNIAWKGRTYGGYLNSSWIGQEAWGGFSRKSISDRCWMSKNSTHIYHSNGTIAWKGGFESDNDENSCKIFYDDGSLVWNGKRGSPGYDKDGKIIAAQVTAMWMPLGDGSWLYVSSKEVQQLYLHLGERSYLIFETDKDPILSMKAALLNF